MSYTSACALSHTPLSYGARVTLVHTGYHDWMPEPYPREHASTYRLMQLTDPAHQAWLADDRTRTDDLMAAHYEQEGRHDDAQMMRSLSAQKREEVFNQREYIAVLGTYDESGWLNLPDGTKYRSGQPRERDIYQPDYKDHRDERLPDEHYFFISAEIIEDTCLDGETLTEANKALALSRLARLAWTTRTQLFGNTHSLLGGQVIQDEEFVAARRLAEAAERQRRRLEAEMDDWDDEDDGEDAQG